MCNLCHNPYFNRWFSAIALANANLTMVKSVTILILIDGFLQYYVDRRDKSDSIGHNPYFNRWFSAMRKEANK